MDEVRSVSAVKEVKEASQLYSEATNRVREFSENAREKIRQVMERTRKENTRKEPTE